MDIEELVIGVKKANLSELKELKVKLPVRLLVNLHYVKLTQSRGISEVVNEALTQYFADFAGLRSNIGASESRPGSVHLSHTEAVTTGLMPSIIQA